MKLIYVGKTKNVFMNDSGTYTLKLKDDATGKDGVFDPGENAVGLSIEGLGRESLKLSAYFFEILKNHDIPTHYVSHDLSANEMEVVPAKIFGKGIEFVCRLKADGSFVKRYGGYCNKKDDLDFLVETTIKDDDRNDPPVTLDILVKLDIMTSEEYEFCKQLTKKAAVVIDDELKTKGLTLYDIKFEFGKGPAGVILIDEISAGCMRVYKDDTIVPPMDLGKYIFQKEG